MKDKLQEELARLKYSFGADFNSSIMDVIRNEIVPIRSIQRVSNLFYVATAACLALFLINTYISNGGLGIDQLLGMGEMGEYDLYNLLNNSGYEN
jgi:hypothetical protein